MALSDEQLKALRDVVLVRFVSRVIEDADRLDGIETMDDWSDVEDAVRRRTDQRIESHVDGIVLQ